MEERISILELKIKQMSEEIGFLKDTMLSLLNIVKQDVQNLEKVVFNLK